MQRVVGMTISSPSRAGNLFTAIFRASSRKVLNVLNALRAQGSLSFQRDRAAPHMRAKKWLDVTFIVRAPVCTMHARLFLQFASYLECWFLCEAMQEVAKTRHSAIEGVMMAVNRLDVPINGQCHLRSAPHDKSCGCGKWWSLRAYPVGVKISSKTKFPLQTK